MQNAILYQLKKKAGLTEEQAVKAVQIVAEFTKSEVPPMLLAIFTPNFSYNGLDKFCIEKIMSNKNKIVRVYPSFKNFYDIYSYNDGLIILGVTINDFKIL